MGMPNSLMHILNNATFILQTLHFLHNVTLIMTRETKNGQKEAREKQKPFYSNLNTKCWLH